MSKATWEEWMDIDLKSQELLAIEMKKHLDSIGKKVKVNKTEKQAYTDAYNNGYENAMVDVKNTLDYINYQLAKINAFEKELG